MIVCDRCKKAHDDEEDVSVRLNAWAVQARTHLEVWEIEENLKSNVCAWESDLCERCIEQLTDFLRNTLKVFMDANVVDNPKT